MEEEKKGQTWQSYSQGTTTNHNTCSAHERPMGMQIALSPTYLHQPRRRSARKDLREGKRRLLSWGWVRSRNSHPDVTPSYCFEPLDAPGVSFVSGRGDHYAALLLLGSQKERIENGCICSWGSSARSNFVQLGSRIFSPFFFLSLLF